MEGPRHCFDGSATKVANLDNRRTLSTDVNGAVNAESDDVGCPMAHAEVVLNLSAEVDSLPVLTNSGECVDGCLLDHASIITDARVPN